jgi:hypothetical protein
MFLATVVLWFSGLNSCSSHLYTWVRAVATQLYLSCIKECGLARSDDSLLMCSLALRQSSLSRQARASLPSLLYDQECMRLAGSAS